MKNLISVLVASAILFPASLGLFANGVYPAKLSQEAEKPEIVTIDSTQYIRQNGILQPVSKWTPIDNRITFRDTIFYNPLFLPVVFDGRILPQDLDFRSKEGFQEHHQPSPNYHLLSPDSTFLPIIHQNNWMQSVRKDYFTNNPAFVKYTIFSFNRTPSINNQMMLSPREFKDQINGKRTDLSTKIELEKYVPKRIYWTKSGEHSLQINQNQYSDNWYAGGNNNYSVINYHKILLNYKREKISWNNTIEWKLNFQKTPADTLHNLSISEDYFRTYSVVGLSLNKMWSYTLTNEIKTPLFQSYKINTSSPKAALLSPLVVNTGLGMTYSLTRNSTLDKYRKLTLSLDLSPLSINYTFVGDNAVDETNFGVEEGKKAKLDIGSTYNANLTYCYNRNSTLSSRLKYFTSYSKVIVESESKFNFAFTRLLSSTIYFYLRYDDGVAPSKKDDSLGYFQYNELIGFGLNYKW
jgi:Protein of unknown function (DUF3078)